MFRTSPLFQFKHGDHVCVFYRSRAFLQGILTPYISEGLRKGERCFCAQQPEVIRALLFDLQFLGFNTDTEKKRGALDLHTIDEVYFPDGGFDSSRLMDLLMASVDESVRNGFTGFRSAGELCWAAKNRAMCDRLLNYERTVSEKFPGRPATGMCQYPMDEFPDDVLASVLDHHKQHIGESSAVSMYSSMDVQYDDFRAEIVADKYVLNPRFYYVVQQQRRRESVLAWGTAPTFEHATAAAENIIRAAANTG